MKKEYTSPEIEVVEFSEDVITTSSILLPIIPIGKGD